MTRWSYTHFFPAALKTPVDNPCTPEHLAKSELIHPHPLNANLFIKCDLLGRMYITLCPDNSVFNKVSVSQADILGRMSLSGRVC